MFLRFNLVSVYCFGTVEASFGNEICLLMHNIGEL